MIIQRATNADIGSILGCLRAAFAPYESQYTPGGYADTVLDESSLRSRLASMTVLVAVGADGRIVGTVAGQMVTAAEGHVRGMAVLPESASTGVGSCLLQAIERELAGKGCSQITLDTTAPLERARRFYEKHGYRPSGRVSDFFGMPLFEYVKVLPESAV